MAEPITTALIAKRVLLLATDKRTWNVIGVLIAAIVTPLALSIFCFCGMADAAAQHNRSAVLLTFQGGSIPPQMPQEFTGHIRAMQDCFAVLDTAIAALNEKIEEGAPLKPNRIKADFYALNFGAPDLALRKAQAEAFAACYTEMQEHTRTVTIPNPDYNPPKDPKKSAQYDVPPTIEVEETYEVLVVTTDMQLVYARLHTLLGADFPPEWQANAAEIFYLVEYGEAALAGESDGLLDALLIDENPEFVGGDFVSPFADGWRSKVTSEFGGRVSPITGKWEGHRGLDMKAAYGTPIRAVASGTVILARYSHSSYGNYVVISHGGGVTSLYAHCSALSVTLGQTVTAGDTIALVGSTGASTGNHLHLEVKTASGLCNPRSVLP